MKSTVTIALPAGLLARLRRAARLAGTGNVSAYARQALEKQLAADEQQVQAMLEAAKRLGSASVNHVSEQAN